MVKVWHSGPGGEAVCKKCGAVYEVTIHRFPMRDNDSYDCDVCGEELASWNDTAAPAFKLISKGDEQKS